MSRNVAIVGAPESGKSELAKALQGQFFLDSNVYAVIDDVAQGVSKKCDVAIGLWAPYMVNSMIASTRLERELSRMRKGAQFISVGTIVDTIVYQSCHSSRIAQQESSEVYRTQVMMAWLGQLFHDHWPYDRVIFLPTHNADDQHNVVYSTQLLEALELYMIPHARIAGTPEERLEQAIDYITNEPTDQDATDPDEQPVREGGSDGEEAGATVEPVSSVPDETREDRPGQLRRANWSDLQVPGDDV